MLRYGYVETKGNWRVGLQEKSVLSLFTEFLVSCFIFPFFAQMRISSFSKETTNFKIKMLIWSDNSECRHTIIQRLYIDLVKQAFVMKLGNILSIPSIYMLIKLLAQTPNWHSGYLQPETFFQGQAICLQMIQHTKMIKHENKCIVHKVQITNELKLYKHNYNL